MYYWYNLSRMESGVATASEAEDQIMAAVEDGPVDQFVLADISCDGAFLTCPLPDAASLDTWQ
jgi:hypothetical protein